MKEILTIIMVLMISTVVFAAQKTDHIPTVKDFEIDKYLGTWYEIARMPHFFEKGLERVTATYSMREDGNIKVLNRGYKTTKQEWKESEGKAWIPDENNPSELKVSFFWPFSADYRIIYLEKDYSLAIVTGNSTKYFWILSRTPTIDNEYYNVLIEKSIDWGFKTDEFIKVNQ